MVVSQRGIVRVVGKAAARWARSGRSGEDADRRWRRRWSEIWPESTEVGELCGQPARDDAQRRRREAGVGLARVETKQREGGQIAPAWRGRRGGRERMGAREQSERVLGEELSIEIDIFFNFSFFLVQKSHQKYRMKSNR